MRQAIAVREGSASLPSCSGAPMVTGRARRRSTATRGPIGVIADHVADAYEYLAGGGSRAGPAAA